MGVPELIPGGVFLNPYNTEGITSAQVRRGTWGDPVYGNSSGDFGLHPGATPKWALNQGLRDAEHREGLARMFIQMPEQERDFFVKSCPSETQHLAKILCGVGTGASGGTGFVDFLLQNAQESFREKYQTVESLSDNFIIYLFGQEATPFQYSGMLKNTYQDDQRVWMTRLYRDVLRGTQLARRRKLVRLRYDSVIVSGVLLGLEMTVDGNLIDGVPFGFTLMPMQYVIFTPDIGAPAQLSTAFTEGSELELSTMAVPSTGQLRVTAPPRKHLPEKVKRKNAKTDNPYPNAKVPPKSKAKTQVTGRVKDQKKTVNTDASVRGFMTRITGPI